jgi:hypothetical protein
VPAAQAEVQARALGEALVGSVATRADLEASARSTRADLEALRQSSRADLQALEIASKCASRRSSSARIDSFKGDLYGKIDTLRWMLGVVVALNAAVFVQVFLRQ